MLIIRLLFNRVAQTIKYLSEQTKKKNLKNGLVRSFTLSMQIYVQTAKWKSYWWIEMNIGKTLQATAFKFIVLISVAVKAVLHFLFTSFFLLTVFTFPFHFTLLFQFFLSTDISHYIDQFHNWRYESFKSNQP